MLLLLLLWLKDTGERRAVDRVRVVVVVVTIVVIACGVGVVPTNAFDVGSILLSILLQELKLKLLLMLLHVLMLYTSKIECITSESGLIHDWHPTQLCYVNKDVIK